MKKLLPDVFVSDYQYKPFILLIKQHWVNRVLYGYQAGGAYGIPSFNLPICVFSRN